MKQTFTIIFGLLLTLTSFSQSIPTNGLVAWYPFNGNANDSSGNGNNGTVNLATLTTDRFGKLNSAYFFNGNGMITVPHNNSLNLTGDFTISSWFKVVSFSTTYNGYTILSKHDGDTGVSGYTYSLEKVPNFEVNFQANPNYNSNTYPGSSGIIIDTNWNNLVVTYSLANNILNYYLNNKLISSIKILFDVTTNQLPLHIGNSASELGTYLGYFKGSIDDIEI